MGSAAETVIQVENVRKEYGSVVAVEDISFEIENEEIFALVGPNGAGKTTLALVLVGQWAFLRRGWHSGVSSATPTLRRVSATPSPFR